ncbi:MAG: hypothetical protein IT233_11595 [Bacteroidia bacterium]|nr:hypothetical protein [Bacteroidia bacterium]
MRLPSKDGFTVPVAYFDELGVRIIRQSHMEEAGTANPFQIPPTYFEELPGQIKASIATEQLYRQKDEVHEIPGDYFKTLSSRVMQKIREEDASEKEVKIVRISRTRAWWAVAAGLLIMTGISSLLFFLKDGATPGNGQFLLSESSTSLVIENPEQFNIDEQSLLEEMGVEMHEGPDESAAEDLLLESGEEISSEINETE